MGGLGFHGAQAKSPLIERRDSLLVLGKEHETLLRIERGFWHATTSEAKLLLVASIQALVTNNG
jgi:hypothetical protein